MTEKQLQARCVKWAKSVGWKARKQSHPGANGALDYLFRRAHRQLVFVEFKSETGRLSKLQELELNDLLNDGFDAAVIDTFDEFKKLLSEFDEDF